MDEILKLQEQMEQLEAKQNAIITKAAEKLPDGNERGFKDDEEKQFDDLTLQRKAIAKQINEKQKIEDFKNQRDLQDAKRKIDVPNIGKGGADEYSMVRAAAAAAKGNWDKAGYEKEIQQDRADKSTSGKSWSERMLFLSPEDTVMTRATNTAGTTGEGKEFVGTTYRPDKLIDVLWNASILGRIPGIINNTGMKGNQSIPVVTSKVTATMVGEIANLPTPELIGSGIKTVSPKEMVTVAAFSRLIDLQSEPAIRNMLNNQVFRAIALKLDEMFVYGTGTAPVLQGITTLGGVNALVQGTNGGALNYKKLMDFYLELAKDNVDGAMTWLMNAKTKYFLHTTLKDAANTNSGYILPEGAMSFNGSPIVTSETVPGNLTKGTANGTCSAVILGKFDETEVYQWGDIALEFDAITLANNSQIVLRSYSFWDFLHKRAENYAVSVDVTTP